MSRGAPRGTGKKPDVVMIRDTAALRALADPLRQRLLGAMETPRTVKELSSDLGRPADRLYYHLNLLEKHGLIRSEDERGRDRRYVIAAGGFAIDPALTLPAADVERLVRSILERVQVEYAGAPRRERDGVKRKMLSLRHVRLTERRRIELMDVLMSVAEEYDEESVGDDLRTYGIVTGMWPVDDRPNGRAR